MESEISPCRTQCCDCGCSCGILDSFSDTSDRSSKRKHDIFELETLNPNQDYILPRVEIQYECSALREMVTKQQQTIQNLASELEEERSAAASAANEAMSMILRLQNDKSEIQMEARQFKRLAEEKMSHNQHETLVLEDLLYSRDQAILSLTCEVQAYRHKMMSCGLDESEIPANDGNEMSRSISMTEISEQVFDLPHEIYPSLRCLENEPCLLPNGDDETIDMEKYVLGETPRSHDMEYQIYQSESNQRHRNKFSTDSMTSSSPFPMNKEVCAEFVRNSPKFGSFKRKEFEENCDSSDTGDEFGDRVYTVDSVYNVPSVNVLVDPSVVSPRESMRLVDPRDLEIQKLYARLHALEADRESMRQAIVSIGAEKAQMVLLKEIAQNLCKEMTPVRRMPETRQPKGIIFSLKSIFEWFISSITFWRKKPHRSRYMVEFSANNLKGLLILLECGPQQWRCIFRTNLPNMAHLRYPEH